MAYPIKLFDFQTEEGRLTGTTFLHDLDKTLTSQFGIIQPVEKLKKFHKFDTDDLPKFLKEIGNRGVMEVVKKLPEGSLNWKGTVGLYGRKTGSVIKKENDIVYRMIINIGDTEIFYINGEGLKDEPVILPNGYALLCSPGMIDKVDIKVKREPHRKGLTNEMKELIPLIRARKYTRSTIVLDLPLEGLEFPEPVTEFETEVTEEVTETTNDEDSIEYEEIEGEGRPAGNIEIGVGVGKEIN